MCGAGTELARISSWGLHVECGHRLSAGDAVEEVWLGGEVEQFDAAPMLSM